jgi:hypothetical protein
VEHPPSVRVCAICTPASPSTGLASIKTVAEGSEQMFWKVTGRHWVPLQKAFAAQALPQLPQFWMSRWTFTQ